MQEASAGHGELKPKKSYPINICFRSNHLLDLSEMGLISLSDIDSEGGLHRHFFTHHRGEGELLPNLQILLTRSVFFF